VTGGDDLKDCIFCKIGKKEVGAKIVHEDEDLLAFEDLHPQAPVHIVLIPKRHIATLDKVSPQEEALLGELIWAATAIARQKKIAESGYRLVLNCNPDGGQLIYHIHLHLLGGRQMHWPPG
jgi:histidine triad (HIT) family protein